MGVSKANKHNQIKTEIPNASKEPSVSSKAQNVDLKDMDILCTFKINKENQKLEKWCIKDQW